MKIKAAILHEQGKEHPFSETQPLTVEEVELAPPGDDEVLIKTGAAGLCHSDLSMIRYIAWAIPSIGFIGTVRGIGDALGQAYRAVEGDIAGVTASLGVAFTSTFVALVISIVIMFLVHQLQLIQERVVLDTQTYCDEKLIRHMQVR